MEAKNYRTAPDFWYAARGTLSLSQRLIRATLAPASVLWAMGSMVRDYTGALRKLPVPVVCIGNVTTGGTGKTPLVSCLAAMMRTEGLHPAVISRGYGAVAQKYPVCAPAATDDVFLGDEAHLLARLLGEHIPVWVCDRRYDGCVRAVEQGADCLILDDGLQDSGLYKDCTFLVVDGTRGFGNGLCMPAGPLRAPLSLTLSRCDVVVCMGDDRAEIARHVDQRNALCSELPRPLLHAALMPSDDERLDALRARGGFMAFCGIGFPDKFYTTLRGCGLRVEATRDFPDHYPYQEADLAALAADATGAGLSLITTEKDAVRLPARWQERVAVLPVAVHWHDNGGPALRDILRDRGVLPRG